MCRPRSSLTASATRRWPIVIDGIVRPIDKRLVRFTIDVPSRDTSRYLPWAKEHGLGRRTLKALTYGHDPTEWYVVARPVPSDEWVAVESRDTFGGAWKPAAVVSP